MGEDALNMNESARTLKVLGHPARLALLRLLAGGERLCVCDLAARLHVDQPTLSRHLHALIETGLVTSKREGVRVYCNIRADRAEALMEKLRSILWQPPEAKEETK